MQNFNDLTKFKWIDENINKNMIELNSTMEKNYILRENYYNMEKEIQKSLSNYHVILRDYQYDIEQKIDEIIKNIKSTIKDSINNVTNDFIDENKTKKMFSVVTRINDIIHKNLWIVTNKDNLWIIKNKKNIDLAQMKVQNKKITALILENDITLNFNFEKDKENKQNLEILKNIII